MPTNIPIVLMHRYFTKIPFTASLRLYGVLTILCSTLLFVPQLYAQGKERDQGEIETRMMHLSAAFETDSLRTLLTQYIDTIQPTVRLYCMYALAVTDEDDALALSCLDSLTQVYADKLTESSLRHLILHKAQLLYQMGAYEELNVYAKAQLRKLRRRKVNETLVAQLQEYDARAMRFADSTSVRGRLLRMIHTNRTMQLYQAFAQDSAQVDSFTRALSRYILARDLYRDQLVQCGEHLLARYSDSLDVTERLACATDIANELFYEGRYAQIDDFVTAFMQNEDIGDIRYRLRRYAQLARHLRTQPAPRICLPHQQQRIHTGGDWPLLIRPLVNGVKQQRMMIDTGSPLTILSPHTAKELGLHQWEDTLRITTMYGISTVRIAIIDSLQIAGAVLYHIPVGILYHASTPPPMGYEQILGINELRRLRYVTLAQDSLILRVAPMATKPNWAYMRSGGIRMYAQVGGYDNYFTFDTGAQRTYLSQEAYPPAQYQDKPIDIVLGQQHSTLTQTSFSQGRATNHAGILGIPFVLGHSAVHLDFPQAALTLGTPVPYHYLTANEQIESGDWFTLAARQEALCFTNDRTTAAAVRVLSDVGEQAPARVLAHVDQAIAGTRGQERAYFVTAKLQALFTLGMYDKAAALCTKTMGIEDCPESLLADLQQDLHLAQVMKQVPRPYASAKGSSAVPINEKKSTIGWAVKGKIGKKNSLLYITPSQPQTTISQRTAEKLGVKIYAQNYYLAGQKVAIGILPTLRIGQDVVLHHIRCVVLPEKDAPTCIGSQALTLCGGIQVSGKQLYLTPAPATQPLRIEEGSLKTLFTNKVRVLTWGKGAEDTIDLRQRWLSGKAISINLHQMRCDY